MTHEFLTDLRCDSYLYQVNQSNMHKDGRFIPIHIYFNISIVSIWFISFSRHNDNFAITI